jgi:hypothetical protein
MERLMYLAVVLTKKSQKQLFSYIDEIVEIPPYWKRIGHHTTVIFKGIKNTLNIGFFPNNVSIGMKVKLVVIGWKMDEKAIAVSVLTNPAPEDLRTENIIPHITVATAPEVKPVYSNELLASGLENSN